MIEQNKRLIHCIQLYFLCNYSVNIILYANLTAYNVITPLINAIIAQGEAECDYCSYCVRQS